MEEVWKDVPGYEEYYQISNQGRARSKDRIRLQRHRSGKMAKHLYKGQLIALDHVGSDCGLLHVYDKDSKATLSMYQLTCQLFGQDCADTLYRSRLQNTIIPDEIWRTIPNHANYEVSNLGRIRRVNKFDKIVLKPWITGQYYHVLLSTDGVEDDVSVHRIVAQVFHPNPDNKPEVNHIDGDKLNNAADNLEWVTRSENAQHAYRTGLTVITAEIREKAHVRAKEVTSIQVYCPELDKTFDSLIDADRFLDISPGRVAYASLYNKSINGYTFQRIIKEA